MHSLGQHDPYTTAVAAAPILGGGFVHSSTVAHRFAGNRLTIDREPLTVAAYQVANLISDFDVARDNKIGLTESSPIMSTSHDHGEAVMRAIRFHHYGGPEVLQLDDVPVPEPGPGQVLLEVSAAGVTLPVVRLTRGATDGGGVPLPHSPGGDVVGRVAAVGPAVHGWRIGQRAAGLAFTGAYAEFTVSAAELLAAVPDDIDDHAAVLLARAGQVAIGALDAARLDPGESVLVTAAAGAVGQLAAQLASVRGAGRVVAAVGSEAKAEVLRASLVRSDAITETEVTTYDRLGEHAQVDVALDGVGGAVQDDVLTALAPFGRLVTFNAEGAPVSANELRIHSRSVIGFNMAHLVGLRPDTYRSNRHVLWELTRTGALRPSVSTVLPLGEAARAHQLMESRQNIGKIVLVP